MSQVPAEARTPGRAKKPPAGAVTAYVASLAGTSLEYYDFAIYSVASALVFPKIFFPETNPLTGTLLSFSTYAVGYLARPLGGVIFGRLGDRIGRKRILVITLLLIGIATVVIGLLPGYATLGVIAPIVLVLLRFAQGVGVGGEWGGAVLLSSEYANPQRKGFWSSAAQIGPPAGTLLANGALAVLSATLSNDAFLAWGWRLAFLASALLVGFGLLIRLKLEETPVFRAIQASGNQPKAPIKEVFARQPRALVAAALCRVGPDVLYSLVTAFVAVYATAELRMNRADVLTAVLIGSAFQLILIPAAGALTDRFNRRLVYGVATAGTAIWAPLFFLTIQGRSVLVLAVGVVVGLALHSFMYGPQAAFITEQFPARLRYAGSSLAYTLAGVIGGAVAPVVFTALLGAWGTWGPLALYVLFACVVTVVGLALGRDPRPEQDERLLKEAAA